MRDTDQLAVMDRVLKGRATDRDRDTMVYATGGAASNATGLISRARRPPLS